MAITMDSIVADATDFATRMINNATGEGPNIANQILSRITGITKQPTLLTEIFTQDPVLRGFVELVGETEALRLSNYAKGIDTIKKTLMPFEKFWEIMDSNLSPELKELLERGANYGDLLEDNDVKLLEKHQHYAVSTLYRCRRFPHGLDSFHCETLEDYITLCNIEFEEYKKMVRVNLERSIAIHEKMRKARIVEQLGDLIEA